VAGGLDGVGDVLDGVTEVPTSSEKYWRVAAAEPLV